MIRRLSLTLNSELFCYKNSLINSKTKMIGISTSGGTPEATTVSNIG